MKGWLAEITANLPRGVLHVMRYTNTRLLYFHMFAQE